MKKHTIENAYYNFIQENEFKDNKEQINIVKKNG